MKKTSRLILLQMSLIIAGLFIISQINFLLFHVLAEMFSIVIMIILFILTWNTFSNLDNYLLKVIGISAFSIASIDFVHTLTYKGMNIFPEFSANTPTQLWILARSLQVIFLLLGMIPSSTKLKKGTLFLISMIIATVGVVLIFFGIFPDCYIEGFGLTRFKKVMEYIIMASVFAVGILLHTRKEEFDTHLYKALQVANGSIIFAELAFTFYIDVYAISNVIGHLLKIITFLIYYRALIEKGLIQPQNVLYFKLNQRNLELEKAIKEISKLQELLPICASCKKIRDDTGYWNEVDDYLLEHQHIKFSHSLCPDCVKKLYPEYS